MWQVQLFSHALAKDQTNSEHALLKAEKRTDTKAQMQMHVAHLGA